MLNYRFIEGKSSRTIVLLHGTGGHFESLIPVGKQIDSEANLISLQGDVIQDGCYRFFKRYRHGEYDVNSIISEGDKIIQTLHNIVVEHQLNDKELLFVGYSNGANMILSLLANGKIQPAGVVLFHPLYPHPYQEMAVDLKQTPIFTTMGRQDSEVPMIENEFVLAQLEQVNADVTVMWTQDHRLTQNEVNAAHDWWHPFTF